MSGIKLTPTEKLIGEVLAARTRQGETLWTLDSDVLPAARKLELAGLIHVTHGIVEKTFRAYLTEAGRTYFMDPAYTPPKPFRGHDHYVKAAGMFVAAAAEEPAGAELDRLLRLAEVNIEMAKLVKP